jgi:hypothetical protein
MDDFRSDLSQTMDELMDGTVTPAIANARVHTVASVIRTYKIQMDYARQTGKTPNLPQLESNGAVR